MKKAQMQQMFVFLMAAIVIISTVYIGYRLFSGFSDAGCDTIKAKFTNDIGDILQESSSFGSRAIKTIRPSCNAAQLCFVDTNAINDAISGDMTKTNSVSDDAIRAIVSSGVKTNIFLKDDVGLQPVGYDEMITVQAPYFICFNNTPKGFVFKTEGQGNAVNILPAR